MRDRAVAWRLRSQLRLAAPSASAARAKGYGPHELLPWSQPLLRLAAPWAPAVFGPARLLASLWSQKPLRLAAPWASTAEGPARHWVLLWSQPPLRLTAPWASTALSLARLRVKSTVQASLRKAAARERGAN